MEVVAVLLRCCKGNQGFFSVLNKFATRRQVKRRRVKYRLQVLSGKRDASGMNESAQYTEQRVDESRICRFQESSVPPDPNVELPPPNKPPPKLVVAAPKAVFDG